MPHVRLTDVTISKLTHSKAQITYWDEGLPAFGVRVGARRKTFIVVMNSGHRIKLGNYPFMSLKDARSEALRRLTINLSLAQHLNETNIQRSSPGRGALQPHTPTTWWRILGKNRQSPLRHLLHQVTFPGESLPLAAPKAWAKNGERSSAQD